MTIAQLLHISRITKIAEEHSVPSLSLNKGGNAMLRRVRSGALKIAVATAVGFGCMAAPAGAQTQAATFKVAADVGLVPFFIRSPTGGVEGFSYDFVVELANRLGYQKAEVVDTPFSAIFAGLFSERYDMIAAPTNITEQRAEQMLFSEPYMAGGISFLVKKGGKVAQLEDLKGKIIAVNNGSFSDKWLQDNQAKYGYEIQRFNKNADAVQAVVIGRAFANLSETPLARWVATQTPMLETAYSHTTGSDYGFAFRKSDAALRIKVENAIECMKTDGTLEKLHVKWFSVAPDAGSSMTKTFPGYGAPGFPGYDATEHEPDCSK